RRRRGAVALGVAATQDRPDGAARDAGRLQLPAPVRLTRARGRGAPVPATRRLRPAGRGTVAWWRGEDRRGRVRGAPPACEGGRAVSARAACEGGKGACEKLSTMSSGSDRPGQRVALARVLTPLPCSPALAIAERGPGAPHGLPSAFFRRASTSAQSRRQASR